MPLTQDAWLRSRYSSARKQTHNVGHWHGRGFFAIGIVPLHAAVKHGHSGVVRELTH